MFLTGKCSQPVIFGFGTTTLLMVEGWDGSQSMRLVYAVDMSTTLAT